MAGTMIATMDGYKAIEDIKEVNIHGKLNTELDEVDTINKVIYEDKTATKLYMENPNVPQTEVEWAEKQIFKKTKNRIEEINQSEYRISITGGGEVPEIGAIKDIKNYVFRIDANTDKLRAAVEEQIVKLKELYPDYEFSAVYGGK
ncbi:MAG: hypothetical protein K6G26_03165 [Lachnospiraceae bacterium]|nr:hypothetical protein [Lachnospiraceae bacterium]